MTNGSPTPITQNSRTFAAVVQVVRRLTYLILIVLLVNSIAAILGLSLLPTNQHPLLIAITGSNALAAALLYALCREIYRKLNTTITLLTMSRQQQRAIIEAIPDTIFVLNDQGELIDHQSRQLHQQGVDFLPWIGASLEELIPEAIKPMVVAAFERAVSNQELQMIKFEIKLLPAQDELRAYELRIIPYEPQRLLALLRDITADKHAREQSLMLELERERVRLVTAFIRNTSHEFRTPLAIIGSGADLLTRIDDPQARNLRIERIREQIGVITALLDKLLLMTRLESRMPLEKRPEDLAEIVNTLVLKFTSASGKAPSAQHRRQIDFSIGSQLSAYPAMIDQSLLNTALNNLLTHMLQSGDQQTPLGLILQPTDTSPYTAAIDFSNPSSDLPKDDVLRYIVERLYRLDEPAESANYSLELAIARKIIELHDGRIDIILLPENRTSLRVQLPLIRQ